MNKTPNPQDQCCENTLADMRRDALRQYDEMASKANHWSSFISHAIQSFVPKRQAVYNAINGERDFQDSCVKDPNNKVMIDLQMGSTLSAIQLNLNKALSEWYRDSEPYTRVTNYLRKIAALCSQAGEKWGMPERVLISESCDNSLTIENDCCTAKPMILDCAPQTKIEQKYAVPFGDCGVGKNPDKCLKIFTPEQAAYNKLLDELIDSKTKSLRSLLINKSKDFIVTFFHEDGEFDFDYVVDDETGERIKAIVSVVKNLNSLKIK